MYKVHIEGENKMAKVKNLIMDMEEQFFSAVQDVAHECETLDQLFAITNSQRDLVAHMSSNEVDDIIGEIWF